MADRTAGMTARRGFALIALLVGSCMALLMLMGCTADDQPPQKLAEQVDLQRYAGRWYIIANIPYFAERGNVGSYFDVSFPDGKVMDVYNGRDRSFDAPLKSFTMGGYVVPDSGNARWRESPFWPVYLSYLILWVDPNYQYALVGYPGRGYGWVLSRAPILDDAAYQGLLTRFAAEGYDISLFRRVSQARDQVGQPGYQ
jgi:apolipoprotein D and lipocalin family protein